MLPALALARGRRGRRSCSPAAAATPPNARRRRRPPAARSSYERNTFQIAIRYITAEGSPNGSPGNAAYAIARSVPEEIWRAPDGSGRITYGADSAPFLPSAADERAWRAAG